MRFVKVFLKEGHEVVPIKTTNWRVVDYKETMVDVEKLILPENAIGYEGSFLENVRKDVKEALMEKISQKKNNSKILSTPLPVLVKTTGVS